MARKGIVPWENGKGELGTEDLKWGSVNATTISGDTVNAKTINAAALGGALTGSVVSSVTRADDGLVVTLADGTATTLPILGETVLGWCRKRRIENSGSSVKLYWEDPKDKFAVWSKTIIVKKEGSYPESPTDGTVVATSTVRDQYLNTPLIDTQSNPENWYYRAFPVSMGGSTSYHTLNRFGFWHYAIYIDREDGCEETCVHNVDNFDNDGYAPLKMIFTDNVENNYLDWGDWENAQFMPRPCMLKSDGTVDYYLNPDNYNQKADGTTTTDISDVNYDGNAMMEWSPVYTKFVTTATKHYIYFCSEKLDGYECYSAKKSDGTYDEHFYTAIYEGRVVNSVLRSLSTGTDGASGSRPTASTTMEQEMTYAKANGSNWNISLWADEDLIKCLGILVMGRLNSAIAVGYNCGSSSTALTHNVGTGNKKGMFFGHYTTSVYATKFFGMENYWGHRWRRVAGCMTDASLNLLVKMTKSTVDGSTVENYNITSSGYINTGIKLPSMSGSYIVDVAADKYGFTIPTTLTKYKGDTGTSSGSSSTYYCDGGWSAANCALIAGGAVSSGAALGLFAFYAASAASYADWVIGASLSYKGF